MKYTVFRFTIKTGFLTGMISNDAMDEQLETKLNSLASKDYEIVSVVNLNHAGSDFIYQIVCRK